VLLKVLVLLGLAAYFAHAGEIGLAGLAVACIIPRLGLILAGLLAITLLVKTWYGSAAILIALIAFNLIGNAVLNRHTPPSETPPT
jgi:hypothetical protein